MPEIFFSIIVAVGQGAAFISVLSRRLMNVRHGWPRTAATIALVAGAFVLPALLVGEGIRSGLLGGALRFAGPAWATAAAWGYILIVAAGIGQFLWMSLVALPRRPKPEALVSAERALYHYRPDERDRNAPAIHAPGPPAETNRSAPPLARPLLHRIKHLDCRFDLEINDYTLAPRGMPAAFDGFAILHLTDIHATQPTPEGWLEFVAAQVDERRPDLIVLTGDVTAESGDLEKAERFLRRLRAPAGVWAIRGNHDFWEAAEELREVFRRCGIGLLDNRGVEIERGGESFELIGIEAPWDELPEKWRTLFAGRPERMRVVLSHSPDHAPEVAALGATLLLTGHTHGGQIRFPLIGSLIVPSKYGKRFDEGWFAVGGLALYVSRGLGAYAPELRVGCRPEVARLVLKAGR